MDGRSGEKPRGSRSTELEDESAGQSGVAKISEGGQNSQCAVATSKKKKKSSSYKMSSKKKGRQLECDINVKSNYICEKLKSLVTGLWICSMIALTALFYYKISSYRSPCCLPTDPDIIVKSLKEQVFGQDEAIASIRRALSMDFRRKIIVFLGGTGQGKTMSSEIIGDLVGMPIEARLVKENYREHINQRDANRLTETCEYNYFILDDLTLNDMEDAVLVLYYTLLANPAKNNITVLLIFNIEVLDENLVPHKNYESSINYINTHFDIFNAPIFFAKFYDLNNQSLKLCAKRAIEHYSITLSEDHANALVALQNCKEIFSKAPLLNDKEYSEGKKSIFSSWIDDFLHSND